MLDPKATFAAIEAKGAEEAKQMLLRGFTTVRDLGGPSFGIKRAIDQGKTVGPRIYPSGAMISQTSGHGDSRLPHERSRRFFGQVSKGEQLGFNFIADGRDEVLTATRENLRYGASQIKVMAGGGAASAYDPLDVTQYTLDEMKAAVEAADDWNTYVTVHAYTPQSGAPRRRSRRQGDRARPAARRGDDQVARRQGRLAQPPGARSGAADRACEMCAKRRTRSSRAPTTRSGGRSSTRSSSPWGTDFLFNPAQNKNQNKDILKLKQWFTPAEALKLVTHDNAQVFALSGPRNPYPGKLGVVEEGALRRSAAGRWRPDRRTSMSSRDPGEELRRHHEGRQGLQEHPRPVRRPPHAASVSAPGVRA